jgi:hypothetical protein
LILLTQYIAFTGLRRFREFLAVDDSTAALDFWTDAQFLAQSMEQLRATGLAFRGAPS